MDMRVHTSRNGVGGEVKIQIQFRYRSTFANNSSPFEW